MWIHKLENDNEEIAYNVVHIDRDKKMKTVKRQAHTERKIKHEVTSHSV